MSYLDDLSRKHDEAVKEVERMMAELHKARGLLETAVDAWESCNTQCGPGGRRPYLTAAWHDAARALLDSTGGGEPSE